MVSTGGRESRGGRLNALGPIKHQAGIVLRAFCARDSICSVVRARPSRRISVGIRSRQPVRAHRRRSIDNRVGCRCGAGEADRPCVRLLCHLCGHCRRQIRQACRGTVIADARRKYRGAVLGSGGGILSDFSASALPGARAAPRLISVLTGRTRTTRSARRFACDSPQLWERRDLLTDSRCPRRRDSTRRIVAAKPPNAASYGSGSSWC